MKIEKRSIETIVYIADDGREFGSESACQRYEEYVQRTLRMKMDLESVHTYELNSYFSDNEDVHDFAINWKDEDEAHRAFNKLVTYEYASFGQIDVFDNMLSEYQYPIRKILSVANWDIWAWGNLDNAMNLTNGVKSALEKCLES